MAKTLEDYLEHIGLRDYAPVFRNHGVTSLQLLKGLDSPAGVESRKAIQTAIAEEGSPVEAPAPEPSGDKAPPAEKHGHVAKSPIAAQQVGKITAQDVQAWIEAEGKSAAQPWRKDPDAEARLKRLQDASAEANDLRAACENATKENKAEVQKKVVGALEKLYAEFKSLGLGAPPSVEDLEKNLNGEFAALEKALSGLSQLTEAAIKQREMTAVELIYAHQLLRGHCLDADGLTEAPGGAVLAMPKRSADVDLFGPGLETLDFGASYRSEGAMMRADRLLETHANAFSVSAQASGAAFMGTGVGAVSASARYAQAQDERHERFTQGSTTFATAIQTRYHWSPMRQIVFSTLQFELSVEALAEVRNLLAADPLQQPRLAQVFMREFGSHVFGRVTLGGWYKYTAKSCATKTESISTLVDAVSKGMDWAASVSATYAGLGGVAKGGTAAAGSVENTRVSGLQMTYNGAHNEVSITTTTLGGVDGLPRETWIGSIQYGPQWRVIQRSAPCPIWKIVDRTRVSQLGTPDAKAADKTDNAGGAGVIVRQDDLHALALLLEKTWVQEIFAPSFPDAGCDLRSLLLKHGIETAQRLETFLAVDLPLLQAASTQVAWRAPAAMPLRHARVAEDPNVTVFRNQLYCTFTGHTEGESHVRFPFVYVFDGTDWHEGPDFVAQYNVVRGIGPVPAAKRLAAVLCRTPSGSAHSFKADVHIDGFAESASRATVALGDFADNAVGPYWPPDAAIVTFLGKTYVFGTNEADLIHVHPLGDKDKPPVDKPKPVAAPLDEPSPGSPAGAKPARAWQALTRSRIAAVVFRKTLYCAYHDKESETLWMTTTTDAEHWTEPVRLPVHGSPYGPSLAAFNGPSGPLIYCAYCGLGPQAPLYIMSSADGLNWNRPAKVRDVVAEQAAAKQHELDDAADDEQDRAQGGAQAAPHAPAHRFISLMGAPALAVYADMDGVALYCFYRVGDAIHYVCYPEAAFDPTALPA